MSLIRGAILNLINSIIETSTRGDKGLAVFVQDQTSGILDLPFLRPLQSTSLAADTVINSRTVTLIPGHGTVAGNVIEIASTLNGSHFIQIEVLSVAGNVLTLAAPVPRVFTIADSVVLISDDNMVVDGTGSPITFSVNPLPNQVGDIVRLTCTITDNADMDFEKFGALAKLASGITLRVKNGDGTYRVIKNFRTNGDIELYSYDARYFENNGGGIRGFSARMTFGGWDKHGAVIRLDGSLSEALEIVIPGNLGGLVSMRWLAQGSEVQGD